jgi:dTDP-glucose pyrophosphorylase
MINIVVPMAGSGRRFEVEGYKEPKPLIDVLGKPMIQSVVDNLNVDGRFIFIIRVEHSIDYDLRNKLEKIKPDCVVIEVKELTEGPACSALLAKKFILNDDPLIIINCDQIIDDFNFCFLMKFAEKKHADGVLGSFISTSDKNSYMTLDPHGGVIEVKEKIIMSNTATNGLHFWRSGRLFVESAMEMIEKNDRYNNEFYIAPSYNYLIKSGLKIFPYFYNLHYPIGTPEDLTNYVKLYQT